MSLPKIVFTDSLVQSKKRILGEITSPPDKSITHRAIILSSLSTHSSQIRNPLHSGDCLSTLRAFQKLGVPIRVGKNSWTVLRGKTNGKNPYRSFSAPISAIDCENSGTTMRLLSGVLSGQPFKSRLMGDRSLSRRPMKRVLEPLSQMGAEIRARKENFSPLVIQGHFPLQPILWKSPVASAQVKSAVLLAALFAKGVTKFQEPTLSRDHTERMMQSLGVSLKRESTISIQGGSSLDELDWTIPGDPSSAAFFVAAALLHPHSELMIRQVNLNPTRIGFIHVLIRMGASIQIENLKTRFGEPIGDLWIRYSQLKGTEIQGLEVPFLIDEIPILAVLATQADGKTTITGAEELRVKESDRLKAIATELTKMGASIEERRDGLLIEGPTPLRGGSLESYSDHRMAMSLWVASSIAVGKSKIVGFDSIAISFPNFLDLWKKIVTR